MKYVKRPIIVNIHSEKLINKIEGFMKRKREEFPKDLEEVINLIFELMSLKLADKDLFIAGKLRGVLSILDSIKTDNVMENEK